MAGGHQLGGCSAWQVPHIWNVMLVPGRSYSQPLEPGVGPPAAVHVALQAASDATLAPAMQPIAQEGFWQAEPVPVQQWPAVAHLDSQVVLGVVPAAAQLHWPCADEVVERRRRAMRRLGMAEVRDDETAAHGQALTALRRGKRESMFL